jgi:hypothetical protein
MKYITTSPSAKCTWGRLSRVQHSGKSYRGCFSRGSGLPRVPNLVHSGKPSPSAMLTLGDDLTSSAPSTVCLVLFLECNTRGRNSFFLNPLPRVQHSGKKLVFFKKTSLSVTGATLGEEFRFLNPLPRVPRTKHLGKSFVF